MSVGDCYLRPVLLEFLSSAKEAHDGCARLRWGLFTPPARFGVVLYVQLLVSYEDNCRLLLNQRLQLLNDEFLVGLAVGELFGLHDGTELVQLFLGRGEGLWALAGAG